MRNKAKLFTALLFALCANWAFAQQITVSGIVKSAESGEPLPGVAVVEKGTSNGTVTNFEGKFDLKVASTASTLVFKSMGMKTAEVKASSSFMSVNLRMEAAQIEEVVVTALGIEREKRALGYSVEEVSGAQIKGSGEANMVPVLHHGLLVYKLPILVELREHLLIFELEATQHLLLMTTNRFLWLTVCQ